MNENKGMRIPHWLLKLLPMWDYICPKCKNEVKQKSHECIHCGEKYGMPLRVPPKILKDAKALEQYVHQNIFPKISTVQREYLTQFFTILFSDGFETNSFINWTTQIGGVVSNAFAHHGAYSALLVQDGLGAHMCQKTLGAIYADLYGRFYVYFTAVQNANSHTDIAGMGRGFYAQGDLLVAVKQYGGVMDFAIFDNELAAFVDSTVPVALGQWYCIDMNYTVAVAGRIRLWIDNILKINIARDTSLRLQVDTIHLGFAILGGVTFTGYFDCAVMADAYIGPEVSAPKGTIAIHAKLAGVI